MADEFHDEEKVNRYRDRKDGEQRGEAVIRLFHNDGIISAAWADSLTLKLTMG